ncbi:hypothetical protein ABPG72_004914 [Tetrahymena utriculariae]
MSCLKEVQNGGIVSWSDSKKNNFLFAVAQTQVSQELHGSEQFLLQIMTFDAAEKGLEPNRLGVTLMQVPASSITWSTFGEDTGNFPYGLICIGHTDGSFVIYDANQIITQTKANPDALAYDIGRLCSIKEFSVPVYAVEYNSYKPNLIAIGGDEVLVVDISKEIENPDIIAPCDTNLHQGGYITSVSWNKKVPHVLASASSNGVAVVWNLKTSQVSFQTPDIYQHTQGPKNLCLAWNPEIPLQFSINYDDEKKPEMHIWDLRDTRGPYVSLENGHVRGISTLSWCTTDPSLIITGGVDQKVVCWNIKNKEIIQSFYLGTDIVSIQWSKIPSLYSVALSDGTVQLYSLDSAEISANPPKWYQPVVGATFAPNNVLTFFSEKNQQQISSKIYRSKEENYQSYHRWFQELEKVIDDNNSTGFCDYKLGNIYKEDTLELDQWRLLRGVAFGSNKEILDALGFKKQEIIKRAEDYTGKKHKYTIEEDNSNTKVQTKQKQSIVFAEVGEKEATDILDNMTSNPQHTQNNSNQDINGSQLKKSHTNSIEEVYLTEQVSKNKNWEAGVEKMIKENMIIGNYEGAIDCSMKCGRMAEALLIAYSQNADLFKQTIDQYFTQQTDNFIKYVFKNLIKNDIEDIAENYDLKSWRECAGLAITCSKNSKEFQQLMDKLAERFIKEKNDDDSAICCFILSQNFQRLVGIYFKRIQALRANITQRAYYMVQSVQKLIILRKVMAQNQQQFRGAENALQTDSKFNTILLELANIALCNSRISIAYKILDQGEPTQLKIAEMKDLIYNVYSDELANKFPKPIIPYSFVKFNVTNQNKPQIEGNQQQRRVFNQVGGQATNPPVTQPILNQNTGRSTHNAPFIPRDQGNMVPPPVNNMIKGGNNPPPVMNTPPVLGNQNQQIAPPPVFNPAGNNFSKPEVKDFIPNPINIGQKQDSSHPIPANHNNKLFKEQIKSTNVVPPRPNQNTVKSTPIAHQNPVNNIQNNSNFDNRPPVLNNQNSQTKPPVVNQPSNNLNESINRVPPVHNPPANIPPSNQNRFVPPNPVKGGSMVPPPIVNQNLVKSESNNNAPPRPNQPVANTGVQGVPPYNPNQVNKFNQPPVNVMSQTRPPISMNINNNQPPVGVVEQNPTTNAPPPLGPTQSRTLSQQSAAYSATRQEIQLIEGFVNANVGLFEQIDPKKKDEHGQHLNQMLSLLKSNQLKQEQISLLCQICNEMGSNKQKEALNTHAKLCRIDFSVHKHWINSLKRLISQK